VTTDNGISRRRRVAAGRAFIEKWQCGKAVFTVWKRLPRRETSKDAGKNKGLDKRLSAPDGEFAPDAWQLTRYNARRELCGRFRLIEKRPETNKGGGMRLSTFT